MLRRKVEKFFGEWKEDKDRNPLIVKGIRQCGKTYSVLDFAKKNYRHVVYSNFLEDSGFKEIFSGSLNMDGLVNYANRSDKSVIKECFRSIPVQLGKENKKFQFSVIKKGSPASRYLGSLQWIEDAGIIKRCYNVSAIELPLQGYAIQDCFKVYMSDTGLFVSMLGREVQADILHGSLWGYRGAIFENLMADFLSKNGRQLYYFHKDTGLEIDFVTRQGPESVLVEVKASSGNAKSARTIMKHPEKYHVGKAYKFGDYNVGPDSEIVTLPLYAAPFVIR